MKAIIGTVLIASLLNGTGADPVCFQLKDSLACKKQKEEKKRDLKKDPVPKPETYHFLNSWEYLDFLDFYPSIPSEPPKENIWDKPEWDEWIDLSPKTP